MIFSQTSFCTKFLVLNFDINIYAEREMYNEFLLLSDQYKLKAYIKALYPKENISELNSWLPDTFY